MAAITSGLVSRPGELRKWTERVFIGIGLIGLFTLAVVLYCGLYF